MAILPCFRGFSRCSEAGLYGCRPVEYLDVVRGGALVRADETEIAREHRRRSVRFAA